MTVSVYYGEALGRYGFGADHPFGPDRIEAFWNEFNKRGLNNKVEICDPVSTDDDTLLLFHTRDYLQKVKERSITGEGYLDFGDTPAFVGVFEAACFVVGSDIDAINRIMQGKTTRAFVPIAGLHHARRDSAAGFCVFNDIGVVIEYLKQQYQMQRIAYVDIDAHHGDGVFYAFEDDPTVIFADTHEDGRYLYPGTGRASETGKGAAQGMKLNLPLPPDTDDAAFFDLWPQVEDFIQQAEPEIIILQAGADSLDGDPITHLCLSSGAHHHAAKQLCAIADRCCQGRLLAMGGGGYNRHNLAQAWNAVIEAMLL